MRAETYAAIGVCSCDCLILAGLPTMFQLSLSHPATFDNVLTVPIRTPPIHPLNHLTVLKSMIVPTSAAAPVGEHLRDAAELALLRVAEGEDGPVLGEQRHVVRAARNLLHSNVWQHTHLRYNRSCGSRFFLLFLLDDRRIRIRLQDALKHTDPDPGGPKNIRIRIQEALKHTDPGCPKKYGLDLGGPKAYGSRSLDKL
jgi:hypothetical protein